VLAALTAPELLKSTRGAMVWHGRDLRRYRRLLSPPLQRLLSCPGAPALPWPAAHSRGLPQAPCPNSLLLPSSSSCSGTALLGPPAKAACTGLRLLFRLPRQDASTHRSFSATFYDSLVPRQLLQHMSAGGFLRRHGRAGPRRGGDAGGGGARPGRGGRARAPRQRRRTRRGRVAIPGGRRAALVGGAVQPVAAAAAAALRRCAPGWARHARRARNGLRRGGLGAARSERRVANPRCPSACGWRCRQGGAQLQRSVGGSRDACRADQHSRVAHPYR